MATPIPLAADAAPVSEGVSFSDWPRTFSMRLENAVKLGRHLLGDSWPATVLPNASVNGKDAHCLSVCATAMRYDERSVSDASFD